MFLLACWIEFFAVRSVACLSGAEGRGQWAIWRKKKNKLLFSGSYISNKVSQKCCALKCSCYSPKFNHREPLPTSPLLDSIITYSLSYSEMPKLFIKAQVNSVSVVSFIYKAPAHNNSHLKVFFFSPLEGKEFAKLDRNPPPKQSISLWGSTW